jgi:NADH-quinone oxidoreductase subunit M
LLGSVVELLVAAVAWAKLGVDGSEALAVEHTWVPSLGISLSLGLDGISMLLVLLSALVLPLVVAGEGVDGRGVPRANPGAFYALIVATQAPLMGVFMAKDAMLFYVCWELALIPVWFLCLLWGEAENRGQIALKFFAYTLFGSLFMLAAFAYVYMHTGEVGARSFAWAEMVKAASSLPVAEQKWVFGGLFLAFAVKMPLFPFHTWQPDTYVSAPKEGAMLLSGLLLKMGSFGLIRWLVPMVPLALHQVGQVAVALSAIGVLYGSCMALVQTDLKRLIAYSSIAHVGLIAAGILAIPVAEGGVIPEHGMVGAVVQMLSHGITVVGLFFVADAIERRAHTRELPALGGLRHSGPGLAWLSLVIVFGSIALPLTSGFVGEFLLLAGVFQYNSILAAVVGLSVVLGATYMLRAYQAAMLGESKNFGGEAVVKGGLSGFEFAVLVPCVALVVVLGVFPQPVLDLVSPDVKQVLSGLAKDFKN